MMIMLRLTLGLASLALEVPEVYFGLRGRNV